MKKRVSRKTGLYTAVLAGTLTVLGVFAPEMPSFASKSHVVADFSVEDISHWDTHNFNKPTDYRKIIMDDRQVLKATSVDSASGLIKKIRVNLRETPFLNWQWKVEQTLNGIDEFKRSGDDFAARVYVIIDGGFFFWDTRALNYVWSSSQPVESHWSNPFSNNAQMLAVESGNSQRGKWVTEKRNVFRDLQRVFGEEIEYIDAVAIMTDSDNSDGQAVAYYGNIYFSSQ